MRFSQNLCFEPLTSVYPETASFGPGLRFRFFAILGIAPLCLRLQKRSGLALNQNLLFLDGHYLIKIDFIYRLRFEKSIIET